tara:strand:+ start:3596 stop:3877 length:282 start_codon:yes stop_codon:yes gene_type:complete
MKEITCICVLLLGLAGQQKVTKSYVPTVAVAAAAEGVVVPKDWLPKRLEDFKLTDTDSPTCKSGQCGTSKPQATIRKTTRRGRRVFRLFRRRR